MDILSCGAGMQSTALALMSCENALRGYAVYPKVPIYDAVIFCDLGKEPPWVYEQVAFIKVACEKAGIPFYNLKSDLYQDYLNNFGKSRVSSIPFWTVDPNGKKGKMPRACTLDYKILKIQQFVRHKLLGYKKYQRLKKEDVRAHTLHIGFSLEEKQRIFDSNYPLFKNRFPLIEMGLERADNYKYILETWELETKASACLFCPYHRNYFFEYLKQNNLNTYQDLVRFDDMLAKYQPLTKIESSLYISRSRKRIADLAPDECMDAEYFNYKGKPIWNGF